MTAVVNERTPSSQGKLIASARKLLTRYGGAQKRRVIWMALFVAGGIGAQLAGPQVIRAFLDSAQTGQVGVKLSLMALAFLGFTILQQALNLAAEYISQVVAWTATNQLRTDLVSHCLRLDMGFHKRHTPGELIERVDGDISSLSNFFSQLIVQVLGNGLLILGILFFLTVERLAVGIVITVYTLVMLFGVGRLQGLATSRWAEARQAAADENGFLEERVSGIEDIQVNNAQAYTLRRFYGLLRAVLIKMRAAFVVSQMSANLINLAYIVGFAIGLWLAVGLYRQGAATIGSAYLIVFYISMLADPIQSIRAQLEDMQQAAAGIQRVEELFATRSALKESPPAEPAKQQARMEGALSVTFDLVSFRYEDGLASQEDEGSGAEAPDEYVLEDVSFTLERGKALGILGRTGSGKTTLTRLLFRLYDPGKGAILLNGIDARAMSLREIRQRVGLVTQDVQIFEASIRDNLTFFDPKVTDERLEEILRDLRLWEWARGLPRGLATPLRKGGRGLSAGEAQLLAFARVYLKNPGLVVLDEASSRLDPVTETRMERAIDRLFSGRTGIIIAHRLRTVERADNLLILENGRVVEYGSRADLASNPSSRYANLRRTGLEEVMA